MADQLNELRKIFDGLHRETQQKLQAATSQLTAAEQRLAEHARQEKEALDRLRAVNAELHSAEADLKAAKSEAETLRSKARGEATSILNNARADALIISERVVNAVRAAATGSVNPTA